MSDSTWAALVGFGVVVGMRLLDWFLPKGRYSKWAERHSSEDDDDRHIRNVKKEEKDA